MIARLTNELLALDIRPLAREGRLKAGHNSTVTWTHGNYKNSIGITANSHAITLSYATQGTQQRYEVGITQTPCNLGGQRHWWKCPRCNRRCAILYGGAVFICRQCAKLHYPIQSASNFDKAIIRAEKIRNRLGWIPGIAHGYGPKPKGMHWKTYQRLINCHRLAEQAAMKLTNQLFKRYK